MTRKQLTQSCLLAAAVSLVLVSSSLAQPHCRQFKVGQKAGTAGQDITISTTAVTIADANVSRCSLLIVNTSANALRCRDATNDGAPTANAGAYIGANASLALGEESQGKIQCIRAGGSDATVSVTEGLP